MSAATEAAGIPFRNALTYAWDLIAIHKRLSEDAGRREQELSLNRGAVVFAVAAWQTYVEKLTSAMVAAAAPPAAASAADKHLYAMLKANVDNQIKRLNVPNTEKTLDLWRWVDFDPSPTWAFTYAWEKQRSVYHGGGFNGHATVTVQQAKDELDTWILVRHKVVHGDQIPAEPKFQALVTGSLNGVPRVKRVDADRCINLILELVDRTAAKAAAQFP